MTIELNNQNLDRRVEQSLEQIQQISSVSALSALQALDPQLLKHLVATVFAGRRYQVESISSSSDEGVDLLLSQGDAQTVVQCKRATDSVGQPAVRDLYGTMVHTGAEEAFLVTTGSITRLAREWAFGKPIQLVDGYTLVEWIQTMPHQGSIRPSNDISDARPSRRWLWPLIAVGLILFGVAAGLALTVFAERMGGNQPIVLAPPQVDGNQAPGQSTEQPEGTADATNVTGMAEGTQPTVTGTVTPPPTPSALPICSRSVDPLFVALYSQEQIGCPSTDLTVVWSAWQPFERGYMYWRQDNDTSYVLLGPSGGSWFAAQVPPGDPNASRGEPPQGFQAPVRGFGYIWANDNAIYQGLGWAMDREKGFCSAMQGFDQGIIIQSTPVDSCSDVGHYNQAQSADWEPVTVIANLDGLWSANGQLSANAGAGETVSQTPPIATDPSIESANPPSASVARTRPVGQGIIRATRMAGLILDGDLTEWETGAWIPIQTVVWGNEQRSGESDLSSSFQMRWAADGLWLAIRVTDDRYRSGPYGTTMWQGDGLEIHLDRELDADFASQEMSADDYQIGISFGPTLNEITAYRWIPYELEGSITIAGAARANSGGYQAELRLPWETFTIPPNQRQAGTLMGFNLSVNDNDSDSPEQETTMSASPARTNHYTPPEWGTLILE